MSRPPEVLHRELPGPQGCAGDGVPHAEPSADEALSDRTGARADEQLALALELNDERLGGRECERRVRRAGQFAARREHALQHQINVQLTRTLWARLKTNRVAGP